MALIHGLHLNHLRGDLLGGLTAAIVALPLALAFGVSSGAGPIAGLYGAIAVGLFASLFGGTPAQISGPTGPMTVVMVAIFTDYLSRDPVHGLATAFTVVMLGGVLQILFGLLRFGRYITLIPFPVISGFMSGIGVIIIILQLAPFMGLPPVAGVLPSLLALPGQIPQANPSALLLGALALAIVLGMPARINRILPAPLAALILVTLLSIALFEGNAVPRIGEIPTGFPSLVMPTIDRELLQHMLGSALLLATLGSIDSLLTSLVADSLTRTDHDSDRELIGQGIGNTLAGLVGGLPGAGATMRTVINIHSGGKTPLSGVIHALVLLAIVAGAAFLTEPIPHAVLAGILIKVGIDIIDWRFLKRAHKTPLIAMALMYGVLLLTVFVDLITAVAAGVFIANMITVKRLTDLQTRSIQTLTGLETELPLSEQERDIMRACKGQILLFRPVGPMSFGAAKGIAHSLNRVERYRCLVLDLSAVPLLDVSATLALEDVIREARSQHKTVLVSGAAPPIDHLLNKLGVYRMIEGSGNHSDRLQALQRAAQLAAPAEES
ncbi:SulP family inorganic anion transporter [Aestuariirhabdus litorea]|uniref:SulP family inorganic anion transporter n=1 Tax=Aestuariirhabdus litorea TaxID=2528527 RepID=A0A3P3VRC3_9GAMM|nr:SulP family inorganic anion transporter [Aestuariirhabdus litorea]RRJ84069.1 SulP family inorganic anion transporter [Aestuariirhabdus litorea]RWW97289.1 STAS domain-containing protein [Endozoicomonadaceae bacterium GTF-13]